jgi:hypothetical protein
MDSPFVGYWYDAEFDTYLEIDSDNSAAIRACTVSDGYRTIVEGALEGSRLTIESTVFNLSVSGNTLVITSQGRTTNLSKAASIPAACESDAIEITSVSPSEASAGLATKFAVNVDYRLSSNDQGIIYMGFNTHSVNSYSFADSLEVQRETGSGTLSATVTPIDYPPPGHFQAFANLSKNPHPAQWIPLAVHSYPISVTQTGKSESARQPVESDYSCQKSEIGNSHPGCSRSTDSFIILSSSLIVSYQDDSKRGCIYDGKTVLRLANVRWNRRCYETRRQPGKS